MRVAKIGIARPQEENQAEQVPLKLEVGIRAQVAAEKPSEVAHDRVVGADQHHRQGQPAERAGRSGLLSLRRSTAREKRNQYCISLSGLRSRREASMPASPLQTGRINGEPSA